MKESKQYHVLNGDMLKEQFPDDIPGEIIVARECLVDGPVQSGSPEELYAIRAGFLYEFYELPSVEEYYSGSAAEFEKIRGLPRGSTVHLWFEDDLFCQVNFWFVGSLLLQYVPGCEASIIRPKIHTRFGFGGLSASELKTAYEERVRISDISKIAGLWESYQAGDLDQLLHTARELEAEYPHILRAAEAHIARIPGEKSPGRPVVTLMEIMEELNTDELGPVFTEFTKREPIYGFGDLQVKRLLNRIRGRQ